MGRLDEQGAWIGDYRRSPVRHQGYVCPLLQPVNEDRDFVVNIGGAVTCEGGGHSMMSQQCSGGRRVFGGDHVGFGERSEGADGQIVEMPDRHRDKRKGSRFTRLAGANP